MKANRRLIFVVAAAAILAAGALLAACSRPGTSASSEPLRYLSAEEPALFNPYATNRSAELALMHLAYSGLTRPGASGTVLPDLAVDVPTLSNGGISRDGRVLRYGLRDDATFSDGTSVMAQDAVATWRYAKSRLAAGAAPARWLDMVTDVRAPSPRTVEVALARPVAWAVGEVLPFVLPAKRLEGDSLNMPLWTRPVGSGPYRLAEWKAGESMRFTANERYHGKAPSIRTIDVRFLPEASKTAEFLAAKGPMVWEWVGSRERDRIGAERPRAVRKGWTDFWWGWVFNVSSPDMQDVRVRRALAMMYPRKRFERLYLQPFPRHEVPEPLRPDSWAYSHRTWTPGEDMRQAVRLLAQAGWVRDPKTRKFTRDGKQLTVFQAWTTRHPYPFNEWLNETQRELSNRLVLAGVVRGQNAPPRNYYVPYTRGGTLATGDFSMGYGAFAGAADPLATWMFDPADVPTLARPYGMNVGRVRDPVLDKLARLAELPAAEAVRRERIQRLVAYLESQAYVLVERPGEKTDLVSRVDGVSPRDGAWGDFWNIEDWTITPAR